MIFVQIQFGRGICLIYSLLGVPINALLIGTLGSYFGKKESELMLRNTKCHVF